MKNIIISIIVIITSSLKAQQNNSVKVEIKNIGEQINSPYLDYSPLIAADGSMMVFTSARPLTEGIMENLRDHIYHSNFDLNKKVWLDGIPFSEKINGTGKNTHATALSNDGQRMLICRADRKNSGDIYETHVLGWEWTEPISLGEPINSVYNESSASITPDGNTIFFVSNRPGGLGGDDIWYCTKKSDGKWTEAANLGAPVNSKDDEESVFFHANGKTLFFSSNGHKSLGGLDIFMTEFDRTSRSWAEPKNIGTPINTGGDDINFVMEANGKTGYYSTIRLGGLGEKDIYSVKFLEEIVKVDLTLLTGRVVNAKGNAVEAKIVVKNKSNGSIIGVFNSNIATGKYLVSLPAGKNYEIEFTAEDYFEYKDSIEIKDKSGYMEVSKDVILTSKKVYSDPLKKGM